MALKEDGDKLRLTIILTRDQKAGLDIEAEKYGIGISALARMAIVEWLAAKNKA